MMVKGEEQRHIKRFLWTEQFEKTLEKQHMQTHGNEMPTALERTYTACCSLAAQCSWWARFRVCVLVWSKPNSAPVAAEHVCRL